MEQVTSTYDLLARLRQMDGDWLKRLSDRNQLDVAHERLGNGLIALTAPTPELKAFALKYADSEEAFGEAAVFHRFRPGK
jgi:hypothetical protein